MSPKVSAGFGLAGKITSRPYLVPSEAIFFVDRTNPKIGKKKNIFLGRPMGHILPVWGHVLVSYEHVWIRYKMEWLETG